MKQKSGLLALIALIAGVWAAIMVFFPALGYENSDTVYTGIHVLTSYEIANIGSIASGNLVFNFLAVLAYGLPLIAGLLVMFARKAGFVAAVLFVVGAILLFILPSYIDVRATALGVSTTFEVDWVMQYGLIVAGGASGVGAIASALVGTNELNASHS